MTRRKFKVGDKVVSKVDRGACRKGWVGTVTFYRDRKYFVKMPNCFTYYLRGAELDAYVEEPKKVEEKETPKFKVGDIVRGISSAYPFTDKRMTKGEVVNCGGDWFVVRVLEHTSNIGIGDTFTVRCEHFEKVEEPKNTIVIYQRDRDVVALDKTTGQKCFAHCHPDDKFDFKTGAKIAFGRLIGEPVEEKTVTPINEFEKGKTYIFDKKTYLSKNPEDGWMNWIDKCDSKVVDVTNSWRGYIDDFIINPLWCKEVPQFKVGDLIEITKIYNGVDLRGCRGVVVQVHPNKYAKVEFTTPTVTATIYLTFNEMKKVE